MDACGVVLLEVLTKLKAIPSTQLLERLEHVHRDQPPLQEPCLAIVVSEGSNDGFAVVRVLEEGVVALTVPSGHLHGPDMSTVRHSAHHSRIDKAHEVGIIGVSAREQVLTGVCVRLVSGGLQLWAEKDLHELRIATFQEDLNCRPLDLWTPISIEICDLLLFEDA